jgi:hypothetical protein
MMASSCEAKSTGHAKGNTGVSSAHSQLLMVLVRHGDASPACTTADGFMQRIPSAVKMAVLTYNLL